VFYVHVSDYRKCYYTEFACRDQVCIPEGKLCDGVANCRDGSDEDNCGWLILSFYTIDLGRLTGKSEPCPHTRASIIIGLASPTAVTAVKRNSVFFLNLQSSACASAVKTHAPLHYRVVIYFSGLLGSWIVWVWV